MSFSEIKGQQQALQILQRAIANQHLAHAYLFVGPEGVGKKKTALALGQYLNCLAQDTDHIESCDLCSSCQKAQQQTHPDFIIIEPDGTSIKIEQIRNLNSKVALRAYEGAYQIIIINDAHLMTPEAANSLLKTLEEPAANTIFILVTAQVQQLPVTIISRSQQIQFKPLSVPLLQDILTVHYPQRKDQLNLVAALARGSVKTAEELLATDTLSTARSQLYDRLKQLPQQSPSELMFWCDQWDKDRPMVKTLLELCQLWYRDQLIWETTGQEALLINQDYLAALAMGGIALQPLTAITAVIENSLRQLDRNTSPRLVLEVCLLKLRRLLATT